MEPFSVTVYRGQSVGRETSIKDVRSVRLSAPVPHHVLAVQTAERPRAPSLERTLAALDRAGAARWPGLKLVVADGYAPAVPSGWLLDASPPPRQGSARTCLRLYNKVAELCPDYRLLTYIQDDVALARNALDYISRVVLDDDLALISWFASWSARTDPCLVVRRLRHFRRSQAITIQRRTVDALLASSVVQRWPFRHACDMMFAHALRDELHGTHFPCIAQHTDGNNSACDHDGARDAPSFVGEDFDALTLIT